MHSLLEGQLKHYFHDPETIPAEYAPFLEAVDAAYRQGDMDRGKLEQALDLSSHGLLEANAELREKEERIRSLIDAIPDSVCFKDGEGRWLVSNMYNVILFRIQGVPYQGKTDADLAAFSPFYREALLTCRQSDELAWQAGKMVRGEEIIPRPDGNELVFDVIKVPLFHPDGSRKGLVVIGRDITDRKRMEDALRESELRYRTIFDAAGSAMVIISKDMQIVLSNVRMERLTGFAKEDMEGRLRLSDLIVPDDLEELRRSLAAGEDRHLARERVELKLRTRHGETRDVLLNFSPIPASDALVAALVDITNRKRLEHQLFQAQKREAIGTLAGGIANDFNNLLMGIQGYVSLMLYPLDKNHPHYQKLKSIEEQVRTGAGLTRQLLGFAHSRRYEAKPTALNEILEKTVAAFGRTHKEIIIHTNYAGDLWTVEVDQGQIEQVLMNLLVNAWQAMPGGGHLYIKSENAALADDGTHPLPCEPGKYIHVSVKDTGIGMDAKTMERIFDPFFTTKELEQGAGLGLAAAYGIVKTHGGVITVESAKRQGSTFNIYLPASEKTIEIPPAPPEAVLTGRGTILIVDDERVIIDVNAKLIHRLGYDVLVATNAEEAVALYGQKRDTIDLVLLDMVMPGRDGGETFEALKAIDPAVRVILTSGYTLDGKAQEIMERGCRAFIQKPFTLQELSQKISEVIEQPPEG